MSPAKTSSVLDDMVSQVMNRRDGGSEPATVAPATPQPEPVPSGSPIQAGEILNLHIAEIGDHLQQIAGILNQMGFTIHLTLSSYQPGKPAVKTDEARKAAEAEADARAAAREQAAFEEKVAAKATAAQAATFIREDESVGWVCPDHGKVEIRTSKKGRGYRACPVAGCVEIERMAR